MSVRRTVHRGTVRSGNCPFGELSFRELSFRRGTVCRGNVFGNCTSGKSPSGNCPDTTPSEVIFCKFLHFSRRGNLYHTCEPYRTKKVFCEKYVFKNFVIFIGKHQCWILFSIKMQTWIMRNILEHLFWKVFANGCFWLQLLSKMVNLCCCTFSVFGQDKHCAKVFFNFFITLEQVFRYLRIRSFLQKNFQVKLLILSSVRKCLFKIKNKELVSLLLTLRGVFRSLSNI